MRKLLLNSTAIASVAAITASITAVTASVAVADVSISAFTEFKYSSRSSQVTANDGTSTTSDSEIAFKFSNKTDSGLTIGYTAELESDEGLASAIAIDESSLSISGGFGTIVLGQNDGAGNNYSFNHSALIAEDQGAVPTSASIGAGTEIAAMSGDARKIAYHLPAMGGFTAGVSHTNSGYTGATDTTEVGAKYVMDAGGNTITLNGSSATTEASTTDTDAQSMGVTFVSGNLSFNLGQATYQALDEDQSTQGAAVSYKMSNGMTVGAYTFKSEDDLDVGEEYSQSGIEASYTIAAGLTAVVNVDDYDYKAATTPDTDGTSTADSGTISSLTIKASF